MEFFFIVTVTGHVISGPYFEYDSARHDALGPGVAREARPVKIEKFFLCPGDAASPCEECVRVIRERGMGAEFKLHHA
jgi:hypothetical protein